MKEIDLVQGSTEWHFYRAQHIMATDASIITWSNPWKNPIRLWKEKVGLMDPEEINESMKVGMEMEPLAREAFIKKVGIDVKPKVIESSEYPWMAASMDGISKDGQIAVEIKCSNNVVHKARKNVIEYYYVCQLQHQMAVCNIERIYYFCFFKGNSIILEIDRDQHLIDKMIKQEKIFYDCMMNMKEPSYPNGILGEDL